MEAKESCSPAAAMESGFAMSSSISAAPRLVRASASLRASGADITSSSMTQALTMLGVAPVISVKSSAAGIPSSEERLLPTSAARKA